MTLGRFASEIIALERRGEHGWEAKDPPTTIATPAYPLEPQLAQTYPELRSASKAYEAYCPDQDANVEPGDRVTYPDGTAYIVVAVEGWGTPLPHKRIVMERR